MGGGVVRSVRHTTYMRLLRALLNGGTPGLEFKYCVRKHSSA